MELINGLKKKGEYREREILKKTWIECEKENLHIKKLTLNLS